MKRRSRSESLYIHGFDPVEQRRLVDQARYLGPWVYTGIDFSRAKRIVEIGCGVGAQSKILLELFPKLEIIGVDLNPKQLAQARRYLRREIKEERIELHEADAAHLEILGREKFDGAFLCWFLEHVPDPLAVLREAKKHLARGATLYATEVFNASLFIDPPCPTLSRYWSQFNERQVELGGHPNVGPKLGSLLKRAGYRDIRTETRTLQFDARDSKARKRFLAYFRELVLSAAPALSESGRVGKHEPAKLARELSLLSRNEAAIVNLAFCRAVARA